MQRTHSFEFRNHLSRNCCLSYSFPFSFYSTKKFLNHGKIAEEFFSSLSFPLMLRPQSPCSERRHRRHRPAATKASFTPNGIIFQYGRTDDTGSVFVDVFGINVLLPVTKNTSVGVGILVDACFIIVRPQQ